MTYVGHEGHQQMNSCKLCEVSDILMIDEVVVVLQLPVNLLRAGRVFVFEPPPGVRANLLRTFSTLPASRMSRVSDVAVLVVRVRVLSASCE